MIEHDIWVNGIRAYQSETHARMAIEVSAPRGCTQFHPMLDWGPRMIYHYRRQHDLPEHPLEAKGYLSIGCAPCRRELIAETDERGGRWLGMNKTECGLHTDLVEQAL